MILWNLQPVWFCFPVHQWKTYVEKLDNDVLELEEKCRDLSKLEYEMRSELQRNDSHKPMVNNNFGIWVEDVARIKIQLDHLRRINNGSIGNCSCWLRHRRNVQLLREVNFLFQSASTLLSYGSVVRESQIFVGKGSTKSEEIWECLMDPKIGSIGIYGPGGVGKTTIIMNIANQLANTDTFDKIVLVTISKNVSWEKVGENIAMQLGINLAECGKRKDEVGEIIDMHLGIDLAEYGKHTDLLSEAEYAYGRQRLLEEIVYEHLQKMERCLFIFDDMWYPSPGWVTNMIPIPTRENGIKTVFISRFRDVCQMMGINKEISLAPLSDEDAWDLFVRETGDQVLDPEIQAIAKEIVIQCEGLPINVVTISRAMRGESDIPPWRQALHYLQTEIQGTGMDPIIRFCYDCLRSDDTRKCFLYCGLFPEDYKFKSKELIGYWIAENYIHNTGDIVASINEGKEILRELIDANMLGMCMEGSTEFFKMHDLIRDFSIFIMNHEENGTVAQAGLWLKRFLIDNKVLEAKKVSLIDNDLQYLYPNRMLSSLSTLLLKDNPLNNFPPSFFSCTPNLQVLDISHSAISFLPSSLCELPKLRALFLQYCTYLDHIPSLAKLQELQYLNLSGTLIKKLPQGIEKLAKLRSLDLSHTPILEYIHPGAISSLTNLEELHMQGSHICKMDSKFAVERLKEIRCLKRLSILTLSAVGFQDHLDTICYLQGHNLKCYSVNVYGTTQDYAEDV